MQMLEITYSYWDGMGHRKVIQVRKGTTIGRFLELVKQQISSEFNDMKMVSAENLLYIKEDLIISHVRTWCNFSRLARLVLVCLPSNLFVLYYLRFHVNDYL